MTDILSLQERATNAILLGESHFREFKSALEGKPNAKKPRLVTQLCREIAEALVAFANADGGELLIGVEDDGTITGIPHDEQDIETMLNAVHTHTHPESQLPLLTATKIQVSGNTILFFAVAKGTTTIYQLPDGRCVRRRDRATLPATFNQIHFERQEIRSREYDRDFVDGATVNDLDIPLLQSIADGYLRGLSVERYLQQTGLGEYTSQGLRLRRAALLLFAKDIYKWHPRSEVRILRVHGTELKSGEAYNVISDEPVRGNIFTLVVEAWEQLRPYLASETEFSGDAKFTQTYIYPEFACQEALVNAVAHRDYSNHSSIEIYIFDDRMEVRSPGALLTTLTVEDLERLENAHESRNVLIARVLRENNYMRELGEGIKRMFELLERTSRTKPRLYSNRLWFSITFPRHPDALT